MSNNNNIAAKVEEMEGPFVGQLCTYSNGVDAYPYTVIAMSKSGHKLTLQERSYRMTDGPNPRTITVENPNGPVEVFTRRKDGSYGRVGRRFGYLHFGTARAYRCPEF